MSSFTFGMGEQETASETKKTIEMFQFKVEIATQLEAMVKDFEAETGIRVNVQTVGGGSDYGAALRAQFATTSTPHIYNIGGPSDVNDWLEYLEPLTDESWVKNAVSGTLDGVTKDGEIYGMPMNMEGYGLIYNKDILESAGINGDSITTFSKLKAAVDKLNSMKDKLGLVSVFSYTTKETWVTGLHSANIAFAQQDNPAQFISDLNGGKTTISGNPVFEQWLNLIDLMINNAQPNLNSVSYDDQVTLFATGMAAFLQQGNWTIGMIEEIDPSIRIGIMPLQINDTAKSNRIPVGVPMYWAVNSDKPADEIAAAKQFFDWMVNSQTGQRYLIEEFKFIPAFTNVDATSADQLSQAVLNESSKRGALPWMFMSFPTNVGMNGFGTEIQGYYMGDVTRKELLEKFDYYWKYGVE
jgi:raffinose/stachyose/melibiose transport system substrate-binding protein